MQKCMYALRDNNVSVAYTGPVIKACLKLAYKEVNQMMSQSTTLDMNYQRLILAQNQLDDTLVKEDHLCLLSDETSKHC